MTGAGTGNLVEDHNKFTFCFCDCCDKAALSSEMVSWGSYLDIKLGAGISKAAFYSCIYKYIDAILDSVALAFKFPNTAKDPIC